MKQLFETVIKQVPEVIFKNLQVHTAIFVIFTIQRPSDTQIGYSGPDALRLELGHKLIQSIGQMQILSILTFFRPEG